jgi:hypothetical protein
MQELDMSGFGTHGEEDDSIEEDDSGLACGNGEYVSEDEEQPTEKRLIADDEAGNSSGNSLCNSQPKISEANFTDRFKSPRMGPWKPPRVGQLAERVEDTRGYISSRQQSPNTSAHDIDGVYQPGLALVSTTPAKKILRKYKKRIPRMDEVWEIGTFIGKSSKKGMKDLLKQFGENTDVEPYKSMQAMELAEECHNRQKARVSWKNAAAQGVVNTIATEVADGVKADPKRPLETYDPDEDNGQGLPSKKVKSVNGADLLLHQIPATTAAFNPVKPIYGLKKASSALKAIKQAARSDMRFDRDQKAGIQVTGSVPPSPNDPLTNDYEEYDAEETALQDTYDTMTVVTDKSGKPVLTFAAQSLTRKLLEKKYEILDLKKEGKLKDVRAAKNKASKVFQKLVNQVKKTIHGDDADSAAEANQVITAAIGITKNGDEL